MTVLQIINQVLRRLRDDEVASLVETDYATMLVDLLAEVQQEVIAAHDWSMFDSTLDVPVDASQRVLDLSRIETNGGDVDDASTPTKRESMLRWDEAGRPMAFVFDDSSDTDGDQMVLVSEETIERLYQQDRDQTNADAYYFSLREHPSRDGLQMTIWPTVSSARHIRIRFWTPEDTVTSDDGANTLLTPSRPLVLGTLMLALNERGEELGEPGNVAERRYYDALGAAIETDIERRGRADRYEFWRA